MAPTPESQATIQAAQEWLTRAYDGSEAAELTGLIHDAQAGDDTALNELRSRFSGPLEFGTAGLRGRLGAGETRMNTTVVAKAAWAVAHWVKNNGGSRIVIGHDARHGSSDFARISAEIASGAGVSVTLLGQCPTPLLAYAVRQLHADAGIMVTASHNPREDNGYKVYGPDGRQIISPTDHDISALISQAQGPYATGEWEQGDDSLTSDYISQTAALADLGENPDLSVAYTPLHGVGGHIMRQIAEKVGITHWHEVAEQAQPDADFPTCAKPNPEEDGVLDLLEELGRRAGADIAIASDPDADRCAVMAYHQGQWRRLSGDDVGALLGAHMITRGTQGSMAASLVSGTLLQAICVSSGIAYTTTLTGFKWITRAAGLAYGYEEALGYCVAPHLVADKDGLSAAVLVCEMAQRAKKNGKTLIDLLEQLWLNHGVHLGAQVSIPMTPEKSRQVCADLLAHPVSNIAGMLVVGVDDMERGEVATLGVRIRLDGGNRLLIRPSGTEPKVKCYAQVIEPVDGGDVHAAQARARARLDQLANSARQLLT